MRVFVTGATGFVGTAVVRELQSAGHHVVGLARSDASAKTLADRGVEVHRGSLEDPESLARGASNADGVVHTAYIHDFARIASSGEADVRAIAAIGGALAGSGRPFVVTSATGVLPPGRLNDETTTGDRTAAGAHRVAAEETMLALRPRGVRAVVLRLPPSVHGDGDYGFVPALVRIAREKGVSAAIGEGASRWPAVHLLDAARVYRLALEKGEPGATFHAVAEEGVPTRAIAAVIGRRLGLPVVSIRSDEAATHFGWMARFFAMDSPASSLQTRRILEWSPREVGLLADLEDGRYFDA